MQSTDYLVSQIERTCRIDDRRVRDAFLAVDRAIFVAPYDQVALSFFQTRNPYDDVAWPVKMSDDGEPLASSTQPSLMAMMLTALEIPDGAHVLEIGAATGYNAALLARIVGAGGMVASIDIEEDVVTKARQAIEQSGAPATVRLLVRDASEGAPEYAPYDRLICTAAASVIPESWIEQLGESGVMIVPLMLRGITVLVVLRKTGPAALHGRVTDPCGFMPIRGPLYRDQHRPALIDGLGTMLADAESTPLPEGLRSAYHAQMQCALHLAVHRPDFRVLMERSPAQIPNFAASLAYGIYHDPTHFAAFQGATIHFTDAGILADLREGIAAWESEGRPGLRDWTVDVGYGDDMADVADGTVSTPLEPRDMVMRFRHARTGGES